MTDRWHDARRRMSRRSVPEPLRGLLTGLLRPRDLPLMPSRPRPGNPDAVVDCALYVDGQREPGRPHYADAYAAARRRRDAFVWLGLHDPGPEVMVSVAGTFGLHALTVEQALGDGHRPVVERHGDIDLLVLRTTQYVEHAELTATSEVVDTGDVMVFLGDRFVITVRHGPVGVVRAEDAVHGDGSVERHRPELVTVDALGDERAGGPAQVGDLFEAHATVGQQRHEAVTRRQPVGWRGKRIRPQRRRGPVQVVNGDWAGGRPARPGRRGAAAASGP